LQHPHDDTISNPSGNRTFESVLAANLSRRRVLQGGIGLAAATFLAPRLADTPVIPLGAVTADAASKLGFKSVPVSTSDTVVVPAGYTAEVLYAWGDPISDGPAFKQDASNTTADQMVQAGMHHDGMYFFPFYRSGGDHPGLTSDHGLLAVNHEYTDDGLLHVGGMKPWTADKVAKSQAAHGVSIIEIELVDGHWRVVRPSVFARRITASTPIALSGPVAATSFVRTAADPNGLTVLGTANNCANGYTPWGTYLTCEENWNGYFSYEQGTVPADMARYGVAKGGFGYRWHEFDERFRADLHPNETDRFGWVVEIDPFSPYRQPVKRTALGRIKHEGATVTLAADNRVVVYMGDDERFEYIYKFVSDRRYVPGNAGLNRDLLDGGTLYAARFNDDGTGEWLPLVFGQKGLTPDKGFSGQAEVLVKTRQAGDAVGATKMDRPEWIAVHPATNDVYCTLTNNSRRTAANANAANPRPANVYGHIIRWKDDKDPGALTFAWDIFVLCGDPKMAAAEGDPSLAGNINGDIFGSPDGLWIDNQGTLWIETDVSTSEINKGDYANIGNNQMLAADIATREIRRFLTGPRGCEITGITMPPDGKTLFINVQHPGEPAEGNNDPKKPTAISTWPDGANAGRPRAATVAIRKKDGGVIGI
jgi:secreted PhoX family phosphatase